MPKRLVLSVLALMLTASVAGAATSSSSPSGDRAAPPAAGTIELAQAPSDSGRRVGGGGGGGAPRVVAPRGPGVGGPGRGVVVGPGRVGSPVVGGRPAFVGRPVGPPVVGVRPLVGGPAVVRGAFIRPYRPFYRRPWFGTVIGGVALGTFLTVAAVGVAPAYAPAPELCWFWADPSLTQGYWDYCAPPY